MPKIVNLLLAKEDLDRLASMLTGCGKSMEEGLAWLIAEGTRHYANDQREWERFSSAGVPDNDPRKMELQYREATAHLLSMRARTLETEERMQVLMERVTALSTEYKGIRSRLFAMQEERRQLQTLLAKSMHAQAEGGAVHKGFWESIHRLLRGHHG